MTTAVRHPFLDHLDRHAEIEAAAPQRLWTPEDGALPALYVSTARRRCSRTPSG
jgi:4,5-DOPA dioxygenase extradiol